MNILTVFTMTNHMGPALLVAAIAIGLTVRVAVLLSQKDHTFPHR
jgi:hypothetical protein